MNIITFQFFLFLLINVNQIQEPFSINIQTITQQAHNYNLTMKRQLPQSSKDDYKSPTVIKKKQKQDNLDKFFHVEKPTKQDPSIQKSNTISSKKSSSNELSKKTNNQHSHKSSQPQYQRPQTLVPQKIVFRSVPLTQQQKDILISNYLNPKHTYVCQTCFKDVTNYSKIYLSQKINCIGCAAKLINTSYTLIKALHDVSLDQFTKQKRRLDRTLYNWNLKDQLLLVEAMELYGLDSYEMIKSHMKSHHTVEQIKQHQLYFIDKFIKQQFGGKQLIDVRKKARQMMREQDEQQQQESEVQYKKRKNRINRNRVQIRQKLMKIFRYNERRDEFGHEIPGLYNLLLSQIDKQQQVKCFKQQQQQLQNKQQLIIKSESEQSRIQLLLKGYKNQQQIKYYQQKIIKQIKFDVLTYENLQIGRIRQEIRQSNKQLQQLRLQQKEKQRWELIKCQVKQKYLLFDQQDKCNKLTYKIKLLDRLVQIDQQAQSQLNILKINYCANNKLNSQDITIQEFASQLPQTIIQNVFKINQVQNIQSQLQLLHL